MIQPVKKLLIKWEIRLKWKLKRGLMCRVRICTGNTRPMMEMGLGRKPRPCTNISMKQQMGKTPVCLLNQPLLWVKWVGKPEEAVFSWRIWRKQQRWHHCPCGWGPVFSYTQEDAWKESIADQNKPPTLVWKPLLERKVFMSINTHEESEQRLREPETLFWTLGMWWPSWLSQACPPLS